MNKLNVIIIEDEIPAARLLHSMITRLRPQWTVTIVPGSVDEAVTWFKENPQPDLIFLGRWKRFRFPFGRTPFLCHYFYDRLRPIRHPCIYRKQHRLYTETH